MAVYTDNFTRADSSTLGANWTNQTGSFQNSIVSNVASGAAGAGTVTSSTWASNMATNNVAVSVTIGSIQSSCWYQIYLRSNTSNQVYFFLRYTGPMFISYNTTGFASPSTGTNPATGTTPALATGDILTFTAMGPTYTGCRNGKQILTWTDSGYTSYPNVDSSHQLVGFGFSPRVAGPPWPGISSFVAQDIAPGQFF